jgi:hypothetical protein
MQAPTGGGSMARKKDKQKLALPPFVPMTWQLLNSAAYKSLSYAARAMLPYFIGKPNVNIRSDLYLKTEFSISYREAQSYGCTTRTFTRVICNLMQKGFIDPIDKGGLRGFGLSCNVFRMSERWKNYDTKDFVEEVEWRSFLPTRKSKAV